MAQNGKLAAKWEKHSHFFWKIKLGGKKYYREKRSCALIVSCASKVAVVNVNLNKNKNCHDFHFEIPV